MSRYNPSYIEKARREIDYQFISKLEVISDKLENKEYIREVVHGGKGVALSGAKVNLFGENADFEVGLTGWTITQVGVVKTSTAISSVEQSFVGTKSVKI